MILVECYNDQALVESMGVRRKSIDHQPGKSRVVRALAKGKGKFGIVDADPGKSEPSEIGSYEPFDMKGDSISLLRKNDRFICVLDPDLEGWIIKRAKTCHLNLKDFGIPDSAEEMHKIPDLHEKKGYLSLIRKLLEQDEEVKQLSKWIREYGR